MTYRMLYIGGAARSGSTLLGEMLGAQPRTFNAGELSLIWRDASRASSCACGSSIPTCPVWGPALEAVEAGTGVTEHDWGALAATRASLAPTRRAQRVIRLARTDRSTWSTEVRRLVTATNTLLEAVCREVDATTIVDSSKTPTGAIFDTLIGQDVRLLHLVRDPRAVVSSSRRSRGVKRHNRDSLPPGAGTLVATARWSQSNLGNLAISRWLPGTMLIRYEDLTHQPTAVLEQLCTSLQIAYDPSTIDNASLVLDGPSHAAVGNPTRANGLVRPIQTDLRWKTEVPPLHAPLVYAATWPLQKAMRRRTHRWS